MSFDSPAAVQWLLGARGTTPLIELPALAREAGVGRAWVKDESQRPLGSFKSLGGVFAGLRALARATNSGDLHSLHRIVDGGGSLPKLICASDGNHGLAVATAARLARTSVRVYLHHLVPASRANRIADCGAEIVWINGTYDDSVDAAMSASRRGEGLLISDTSLDEHDPVVEDVVTGYELIAEEVVEQLREQRHLFPTHLFVQAGVGGLAAGVTRGLAKFADTECHTVVVEPETVACVGQALRTAKIERLAGSLETAADMLSCGEASAVALRILRHHTAKAMTVTEQSLFDAVTTLARCGGPLTTPSGATGVAGLLSPSAARIANLTPDSCVLLIVSEAAPYQGHDDQ